MKKNTKIKPYKNMAAFAQVAKKEESDFIALASHQLRTPLTVANLYADMLRAGHLGTLNKEQMNAVEEISFYHQKISDCLAEFLVASKVELGTFEILPCAVNLLEALDEAIKKVALMSKHHRVTVRKHIPRKVLPVCIDREVLRIVLHQLLSNAIKFNKPGGTVDLKLTSSPKGVCLSVIDTGRGIAEEEQSLIFNKQHRGRRGGVSKTSGIGFGLYVSKKLMNLGGGTISFSSRPAAGTTFVLSIPVVSGP